VSLHNRHDALVREYLRRLGWGLREMEPNDRDQLMAEITDHIALARAELPSPSDDDVRALLDRMGPPEAIVAEAAEQAAGSRTARANGVAPHPSGAGEAALEMLLDGGAGNWTGESARPGTGEPATERLTAVQKAAATEDARRAVSLLLAGGLLLVVGWFVGVVLLWRSGIFTLQDKVIGTLVLPGGVLPALYVLVWPVGGGGSVVRLLEFAVCVLLPVATSIYLHRRLRARQVATGFETFRARRAAHAAERSRNEMGLG
jgi:hypothetical protein